jgi:hypothetical protein
MWTKGILSKYLFIYDSNLDRLSRDEEVTRKKLLGEQQALIQHLRGIIRLMKSGLEEKETQIRAFA